MQRRELFSSFAGVGVCAPVRTECAGDRIPNVVLTTHEGAQARFYDDLVKGKQVIVNMMYTSCTAYCPAITTRLVEIHAALGNRMGRDLFMYSVSLKPDEDDPAALRAFAEMHDALLPGWKFLTGSAYDIETLRYALFKHGHIGIDLDVDVHTGRLRIINDAIDRWVHVAPLASTYTVLQHISWADTPKSFEERVEENRRLQERIDEEEQKFGYRKVI
jgi:protein SCO1/2